METRRTRPRGLDDADVFLRDGSTVRVRAVKPGDREALKRFLANLSEQSRVFRFFNAVKDLSWGRGALRPRRLPRRAQPGSAARSGRRMLTVFRESGFTVSARSSSGVMEVMLPTLGNGRLGRWQLPLAGTWRT